MYLKVVFIRDGRGDYDLPSLMRQGLLQVCCFSCPFLCINFTEQIPAGMPYSNHGEMGLVGAESKKHLVWLETKSVKLPLCNWLPSIGESKEVS